MPRKRRVAARSTTVETQRDQLRRFDRARSAGFDRVLDDGTPYSMPKPEAARHYDANRDVYRREFVDRPEINAWPVAVFDADPEWRTPAVEALRRRAAEITRRNQISNDVRASEWGPGEALVVDAKSPTLLARTGGPDGTRRNVGTIG